ncbi:phosphoribosylanthranilate isomerase [Thomasclavelia sp.]|uniref:phosphoribosylanthranilate isomerase n=1 Tax=Thomasclavelia sp. TaxID=3025757 RepID=UPI0025EAFAAD|nr:phosphoribosylanthranilate isomerase [Thomasclavelia sp.]
MKIKICGLFQNEDINYVNEALPDYIGFVFAKSKRQVSYNQARALRQNLNAKIKVVGVFVNAKIAEIEFLVNQKIIDLIQLHGDESDEYIKQLKSKVKVPIIKAIKVADQNSLTDLNYSVDYYLLDNVISGSGKVFNWSYIKQLDKPYFLAGGINLDNLDAALKINAYCLDVSSGVETNGVKDGLKIKEMVRRVKENGR